MWPPRLSNSSPDHSWRRRIIGRPLRDTLAGFHSARLGSEWGVLYRIDESKHAVIVQDIQHRSTAYRRR